FDARVKKIVAMLDGYSVRYALSRRARRLKRLSERAEKLDRIIKERARSPEMRDVPGGTTGLLTVEVKSVGGREVKVYSVDTALLKELREHEKQAAIEAAQWLEKSPEANPPTPQIQVV